MTAIYLDHNAITTIDLAARAAQLMRGGAAC